MQMAGTEDEQRRKVRSGVTFSLVLVSPNDNCCLLFDLFFFFPIVRVSSFLLLVTTSSLPFPSLSTSLPNHGPAPSPATPAHPRGSSFYLGADIQFLSNRAGPFSLQPRGIQWTHGALSGCSRQPSATCVSFILLKLVPPI